MGEYKFESVRLAKIRQHKFLNKLNELGYLLNIDSIESYVTKAEAARARHLSGTNQIGQFKPRSSGGAASSLGGTSKTINQLLDAQRERARQLAGQK